MSDATWDPTVAERETRGSVAELVAESGLASGTPITLDLRFVPGSDADRPGFIAAMRAAGYAGAAYEAGGREELEASLPQIPLTPDAVWAEEARAAEIALAHGYEPAGWGFEEP